MVMDTILNYSIVILMCIGVISLLIIGWQYITGRPYWGQSRDSILIPCLFACVIPLINVIFVMLMTVGCIIGAILIGINDLREKAIDRREKAEQDRAIEKIRKYHEYEKNQSSRHKK